MKPAIRVNALFFLCMLLCGIGSVSGQGNSVLDMLSKKDTVRILITDSGLGGVSVVAGIDSVLTSNKIFANTEITFCNALPSAGFRYNELPDAKSKAKVFSGMLYKMQELYRPDFILIACNTLSVVYSLTEFAATTNVPVMGIVEFGAKAIADSMKASPKSAVLILGTETTIQSDAYRQSLLRYGIDSSAIEGKACPNLESEIQVDPASDMTSNLIDFYIDEVPDSYKSNDGTCFAALCCTHYGFAREVFQKKLDAVCKRAVIINPNASMIKTFADASRPALGKSKISVSVCSQAVLSLEERDSIAKLVGPVSHKTADALIRYVLLQGIFK
jgi:glutamate racemase